MVSLNSSFENKDEATKAIFEMVYADEVSILPIGVIPTISSPLCVVPKPHSGKLRLIVDMRYVHEHIVMSIQVQRSFSHSRHC